jgi:CheY-like chemotaxis protein
VVTVTDGQTALMRLADVDPDLVFADVSLPTKTGYEICREIKSRQRHRHVRVVLTAGLLEPFDESKASDVRCDAVLKKPFESSVMLSTIRPLIEAAQNERGEGEEILVFEPASGPVPVRVVTAPGAPTEPAQIDVERVRAAVTIALDAALPSMIDKITEQVLVALGH